MNKNQRPACGHVAAAPSAPSLIRASGLVRLAEAAAAAAAWEPEALAWLRLPSRGCSTAARLRQRAMYLCHVGLGVTLTDTGRALGRDRTTVRHGCMAVEELRVQAAEDQALTALEWGLRAQAAAWLAWFRPVQEEPIHG